MRLASGASRTTVCGPRVGDDAPELDAAQFATGDARALARFCAAGDDDAAANEAQPPALGVRLAEHPSRQIRATATGSCG